MSVVLGVLIFAFGMFCGWLASQDDEVVTECDADSHDFDLIHTEDRKATFVCMDCGKKLVVEL